MSDGIIDLTQYIRDREEERSPARGAFALWGADGERSRFALPLWRVIYIAGAGRGGIVWTEAGSDAVHPFVVLDLEQDPPRIDFPPSAAARLVDADGPCLDETPDADGGIALFLGSHSGRRWYLLVTGGEAREPLRASDREDILFLAGECAGLLFLRDFASQAGPPLGDRE